MTPQTDLLYHVIAQPNSRDAVHSMLGMNRQVSLRQNRQACGHLTHTYTHTAVLTANAAMLNGRGGTGQTGSSCHGDGGECGRGRGEGARGVESTGQQVGLLLLPSAYQHHISD